MASHEQDGLAVTKPSTAIAACTWYACKKYPKLDRETAIIFDDDRQDCGERRQVCLGRMRDEVVVVALTFRGDALRVISS